MDDTTTPKVLSREEIDALTTSTSPYRLRYKIVGSAPGEDGATLNWIYKSVEDEDTADLVVQNLTSSTCVPSLETTLQHQAKRIDSLRAQLRGVNRKLREERKCAERMAKNYAENVASYAAETQSWVLKYWALHELHEHRKTLDADIRDLITDLYAECRTEAEGCTERLTPTVWATYAKRCEEVLNRTAPPPTTPESTP